MVIFSAVLMMSLSWSEVDLSEFGFVETCKRTCLPVPACRVEEFTFLVLLGTTSIMCLDWHSFGNLIWQWYMSHGRKDPIVRTFVSIDLHTQLLAAQHWETRLADN